MAGLALLAGGLFLMARSAQQAAEQHRTEAEELMGYMLGDFVDKLRPLGKLDLLDSVSNRALKYLSDPVLSGEGSTALAQRAKSLQLIAEVKIARADPTGANTALLAGRVILQKQLLENPTDMVLLKSAGETAFWLGQIQLDRNEWEQSRRYFNEYRGYADRQAKISPASVDALIEQSYAHSNLGTVALRSGDVSSAADEFAQSVALKQRAHIQDPKNKRLAADLANSLSWQASAHMQLGQLHVAETLGERERALLQALHDSNPADTLWMNRLASAWSHQSDLQQARGNLGASHDAILRAHALLQATVEKDPSNRNWQRNLYIAELRSVETDGGRQKPAQLLARLNLLQQHFTELSRLEPKKLNLQTMLAIVQQHQAGLHLREHRNEEAAERLKPAVETLQQLYATTPNDPIIRSGLVDALLESAELSAITDPEAARRHCDSVRTVLRPVVNGSADFRVLAPWVKAHACLDLAEQAAPARKQLEAMSYRDPAYLQYLSTHPSKKASS